MTKESNYGKAEYLVLEMDGEKHYLKSMTGCCDDCSDECPHCGGAIHSQPIYGGLAKQCEQCKQ